MSAATRMVPADQELVVTRLFAAPPGVIFEAWIRSEHLVRWRGLPCPAATVCEIDPRPGGAWRIRSQSADGTAIAEHGMFREVAPAARLVFTHVLEDAEGKPGCETQVTVTFEEHAAGTRMTLRQRQATTLSAAGCTT